MPAKQRYQLLSSFNDFKTIEKLIISYNNISSDFNDKWGKIAIDIRNKSNDVKDVMISDMQLVLAGDMLPKVDMMSMAHSLEVRPPFLDKNVVSFAFSIPTSFKISGGFNKRILRDAFSNELPPEILKRQKHGFEVPMNKWFKTHLFSMIDRNLMSYEFIESQRLFRHDIIKGIVNTALNRKHHDLQAMMWCLLVFQHWYIKYESHIKKDWI